MDSIINALRRGKLDNIESLINGNVNLDYQDQKGITALQIAVSEAHIDIVELLLNNGANPDIIADVPDDNIDYLLNSEDCNELSDASILGKLIDELQGLGAASALHIAVKNKQPEMVKLLLSYNANSNILDPGKCTPLHWAAARGLVEIVELLLLAGADPDIQDLAKSTALHEAVRKENIAIIELLLKHNADPNLRDISGETPYCMAKNNQNRDILNHILLNTLYVPDEIVSH